VGTIFISQTQRKPFLSISCTLCLGMFVMWWRFYGYSVYL
jgi:hypothetical protein